jgi:hypothetical protein
LAQFLRVVRVLWHESVFNTPEPTSLPKIPLAVYGFSASQ